MADTKVNEKELLDLYNKGVAPDAIGEKYGLTGQEVVDIVTKPVTNEPAATVAPETPKTEEVKKK